jgi:hypothetical protein
MDASPGRQRDAWSGVNELGLTQRESCSRESRSFDGAPAAVARGEGVVMKVEVNRAALAAKTGIVPAAAALAVGGLLVALLAVLTALPSVAAAESCPNAVYRNGPSSRLPDCRAYEMVTPPYKEGFPVYVGTSGFASAFSADGSRMAGESVGAFAGAEDSRFDTQESFIDNGAGYVFTRGEAGWETTAVSPSAAEYPLAFWVGSSSDLSRTLWVAATTAQEEERARAGSSRPLESFYVRSSNEPPVEVGSILPPSATPAEAEQNRFYKFGGASTNDLSVVLYGLSGQHWPGDETEAGAESLYEYVGTGNSAPLLVGVSGGAGSTSLISRCGTRLSIRGSSGKPSPAISEDGSTVFFTALACGSSPLVQELYARVDNGTSAAHTVAISEPSEADCSACETAGGARQPASAVGFSSDGSKAFFTTTQPLLGGDSSENLYEYDFDGEAGQRVVRVSGGDATVVDPVAGVERVVGLSPDGSHVYFTASGVLTRTPNGLGQEAEAGQSNLYLYERDAQYPDGRTVFVLPGADLTGETGISENGDFLVFSSTAQLTPDDTSSVAQAFEYDAQTGGLVRVSIGKEGFNEDGNTGSVEALMVADDGSVYFESVNPLVAQAVSGQSNVYEYREGEVNLISDGQDTRGATLRGISASGVDVFFDTFDRLVPRDTDSQEDTYDARVDGGFSEPLPPPSCEADACQGPLSGAPVLLSPGSEFQAGGENIATPAPEVPKVAKKAVKHKPKARKGAKKRAKGRKRGRKASHSGHSARTGGRS